MIEVREAASADIAAICALGDDVNNCIIARGRTSSRRRPPPNAIGNSGSQASDATW
jgi:hypothetical protein